MLAGFENGEKVYDKLLQRAAAPFKLFRRAPLVPFLTMIILERTDEEVNRCCRDITYVHVDFGLTTFTLAKIARYTKLASI